MKVITRHTTSHGRAQSRVRFSVRAKPRAKKSQITGERGDDVEVSLAAPPVDGAANEELVTTLARALGLPRRQIFLVGGETSRTKLIEVEGLSAEDVELRLRALLPKAKSG